MKKDLMPSRTMKSVVREREISQMAGCSMYCKNLVDIYWCLDKNKEWLGIIFELRWYTCSNRFPFKAYFYSIFFFFSRFIEEQICILLHVFVGAIQDSLISFTKKINKKRKKNSCAFPLTLVMLFSSSVLILKFKIFFDS